MMAERSPRPDVPSLVTTISSCSQALTVGQLSPGIVAAELPLASDQAAIDVPLASDRAGDNQAGASDHAATASPAAPVQPCAAGSGSSSISDLSPQARIAASSERPRLVPLGTQRFALQFTIDQDTHDDLLRVQELLSHRQVSGDIAKVFALALKALRGQLEKQKFAATNRPRSATTNPGSAQPPSRPSFT